jgi:hypothetical protein
MYLIEFTYILEAIYLAPQDAQQSSVPWITYLFSEIFLISDHPLSSHIRATLRKKGDHCGSIPISVIDAKNYRLCKFIYPEVESNLSSSA